MKPESNRPPHGFFTDALVSGLLIGHPGCFQMGLGRFLTMAPRAAGIALCLLGSATFAGCTALAQAKPDEPLENTYWRLDWLPDAAIGIAPGAREPHFILHRDGRRVTGSDGCNRFTGSYQLAGEQLAFEKMAATMMACQESVESERAFRAALGRARTAKVSAQRLELLDTDGRLLARFQAVHFK